MQFEISVLSVSAPQFVKTAKGGYNTLEVAYKKDGKIEGKKLVDFAAPEVYKAALALTPGVVAVVTAEKQLNQRDQKEYWQWVQLSLGGAAPAESSAASKPVGRVTGSNYETPEERARKQVYIVRQSSLTTAISYFELLKAKPETKAVLELAREFEEYVFGDGKVARTEAPVGSFDDMEDDIPL